ncbi:hypothetical protein ACF0H5_000900 [Mactra antiquata]
MDRRGSLVRVMKGGSRKMSRTKKCSIGLMMVVICYVLLGLNMYIKGTYPTNIRLFSRDDTLSTNDQGDVNTPVVIVGYMRSGSTLTGNIIQRDPATFYAFEPLHHLFSEYYMQYGRKFPDLNVRTYRPSMLLKEEAQYIFRAWFSCDFDFLLEKPYRYFFNFFKHGIKTKKLVDCLNKTSEAGIKGMSYSTLCTSILKKQCLKSRYRVIKTIRMPIHWLYELMSEFPTMKIIHLVRDPRAIVASQHRYSACTLRNGGIIGCARLLCSCMEDDVTMYGVFKDKFPGRTLSMKFEDLANDPLGVTQTLYKYLNLEITDSVVQYVVNATMSGNQPEHVLDSVRPDSKAIVDAWRKELSPFNLETVQTLCKYTMEQLSYYHFIKPYNSTK